MPDNQLPSPQLHDHSSISSVPPHLRDYVQMNYVVPFSYKVLLVSAGLFISAALIWAWAGHIIIAVDATGQVTDERIRTRILSWDLQQGIPRAGMQAVIRSLTVPDATASNGIIEQVESRVDTIDGESRLVYDIVLTNPAQLPDGTPVSVSIILDRIRPISRLVR